MTADSDKKPVKRPPPGTRLDWRMVLGWMRDDGLIDATAADDVDRRFGAGASNQHPLIRLGSACMMSAADQHLLDTETLTEWLARRFGFGYQRIDPLKVDVGRISEVMSAQYAEQRRALPLTIAATEVTIATCEPFDTAWTTDIESHLRRGVRLVLANPEDIARHTADFYAIARSVRAAQKTTEATSAISFEQLVEMGRNRSLDANDQGVIQVVDWLWQYAFDQRASDIHLEPRRDFGTIRLRIDGALHNAYQVPMTVMAAMTARIKVLGRMDVIERRRPQDGRIKTRRPDTAGTAGGEIELRLSTLPTAFGEKVVMRIFDPETVVKGVEALGMSSHDLARWRELVAKPHGIVLVTGPTGSGKTTTLYSTLKAIATDQVNVCTIEDPIEMVEPAFNQTQVQAAVELDFAEGLRALMRQDPDIIMVGEIRDRETAEMAIQAALTGHLVFSTMHTNDATSAATRLIDLGIPPYLVAATVIGILAQRLARRLCTACRERDDETSRATLDEIVKPWRLSGGVRPYKAAGCAECRKTGYRGRVGLYELLVVSDAARAAMHPNLDLAALRKQAVKDGMHPLRLAGTMKVAEGVTTIDEVLRTTPNW